MSTAFNDMDKGRNGEVRGKKLKFKAYQNAMPATQDIAPYLGRMDLPAAKTQDDVVDRMVQNGCYLGKAEVTRILNGMGFCVMDSMRDEPGIHDLGFVRLFPVMDGGLPSVDAEFDPERNRIYIAANLCDEIRDALMGRTASQLLDVAQLRIEKVTWGNGTEKNTIKSGEDFCIYGIGISVGDDDEFAELILPDGAMVAVELDPQVPVSDAQQRVHGRLAQPVAACEGARIVIHTHGLNKASSLKLVTSKKLTVLAGATPTGPTLTGVHAPGIETPMIHLESGIWFDGTNLDGWSTGRDRIEGKNNRAEEAEFVRLDGEGTEVAFNGGMLKMDEGAWSVLNELGIVEGSEVRFKVTIAGQSAEIVATVAEA